LSYQKNPQSSIVNIVGSLKNDHQLYLGTYGEQYDEAGWKLNLEIEDSKERSGVEQNPMKCKYESRVLVNNWVEERRDRQYVKYDNAPRLSQVEFTYSSIE